MNDPPGNREQEQQEDEVEEHHRVISDTESTSAVVEEEAQQQATTTAASSQPQEQAEELPPNGPLETMSRDSLHHHQQQHQQQEEEKQYKDVAEASTELQHNNRTRQEEDASSTTAATAAPFSSVQHQEGLLNLQPHSDPQSTDQGEQKSRAPPPPPLDTTANNSNRATGTHSATTTTTAPIPPPFPRHFFPEGAAAVVPPGIHMPHMSLPAAPPFLTPPPYTPPAFPMSPAAPPSHHWMMGIPPPAVAAASSTSGPFPPSPPAVALQQYYELQMRDHAAAYANAAAAWTALQHQQQQQQQQQLSYQGGPPPSSFPFFGTSPVHFGAWNPTSPPVMLGQDPYHSVSPTALSHPSDANGTFYYAHPGMGTVPPPTNTAAAATERGSSLVTTQKEKDKANSAAHRQENGDHYDNDNAECDENHTGNDHDDEESPSQQHKLRRGSSTFAAPGIPSSRRKRTHTRPPSEVAVSYSGKVRRRLRSDGDSSSSGGSSWGWTSNTGANRGQTNYNNHPNSNNNNNSSNNNAMYNHHKSRSGSSSRRKHPKKARSDATILGKTALPALYEWCSKRQLEPQFEPQFAGSRTASQYHFTVTIQLEDRIICESGNGSNKITAKQMAARKALQRLVPGIVFDPATGILVELNASSADDLAHLAKQLAIGQGEEEAATNAATAVALNDASKKRSSSSSSAPPKRTLDVYPGTSTTTSEDEESTYVGASVCTSLLVAIIQLDPTLPENPTYSYTFDATARTYPNAHLRRKVASSNRVIHVNRGPTTCLARLPQIQADGTRRTLEAQGTGSNKRESRQNASAQLLALLFPDCQDMVEVKAAAEAAREQLVKARANKRPSGRSGEAGQAAVAPKPSRLTQWRLDWQETADTMPVVVPQILSIPVDASPETSARRDSRLRQVEAQVDRALQRLKDEHESLPPELTEDDVGRTILRRAGPEDLPRIRKLLDERSASDDELSSRWWSTSSFALLLCRAIAALEDPPLGCAVLTLGFDMEKGKVLRVAQIGNEPHLPRERLLECLQTFAVCMNATLVVPTRKHEDEQEQQQRTGVVVETTPVRSIRSLLASWVVASPVPLPPTATASSSSRWREWPLQSVQEEEESEGASSMERRKASSQRASTKPSKRTRRL